MNASTAQPQICAWADRSTAKFADEAVAVISVRHLIANKRTVGRAQDIADVESLAKLGKP